MSYNREDRQMFDANAVIVVPIVKYHFNQKKRDLYIAENVSEITDQHQEIETDLVVEDLVEEMIDHDKCMMQNAVIVVPIVKYHFNQKKTDLYIAENVSKSQIIKQIVLGKHSKLCNFIKFSK